MNSRILLGMTFTLALVSLGTSAFAQAAAESALLGAGSSTATVKAGSALNSILNQSGKQLAGRIQRQMLQPTPGKIPQTGTRLRSTNPITVTAARGSTTPQHGALITSIQGAAASCALTDQTASTPAGKNALEPAQTNCSQGSASKPVPQKYKSAITLSFPK